VSKLFVRRAHSGRIAEVKRIRSPSSAAARSRIFTRSTSDTRLDRPLRAMAVPHQAVAAVGKLQALHCEEKRLGLHLDCLRKQLPRTRSQDIRQWIVDLVGLTQRDNVDILAHGVSLSLRGSGRLRHPPRYAAYLIPSSPSFPHSSASGRGTPCGLRSVLVSPARSDLDHLLGGRLQRQRNWLIAKLASMLRGSSEAKSRANCR